MVVARGQRRALEILSPSFTQYDSSEEGGGGERGNREKGLHLGLGGGGGRRVAAAVPGWPKGSRRWDGSSAFLLLPSPNEYGTLQGEPSYIRKEGHFYCFLLPMY